MRNVEQRSVLGSSSFLKFVVGNLKPSKCDISANIPFLGGDFVYFSMKLWLISSGLVLAAYRLMRME